MPQGFLARVASFRVTFPCSAVIPSEHCERGISSGALLGNEVISAEVPIDLAAGITVSDYIHRDGKLDPKWKILKRLRQAYQHPTGQ